MGPFLVAVLVFALAQDARPTVERVLPGQQQPKIVSRKPPEYPEKASEARLTGTVVMDVTVGIDGRVSDVQVLRGIPLLSRAAVSAVRKWRYEPLLLDGRPVPFVIAVTTVFNVPGPQLNAGDLTRLIQSKDVELSESAAVFVGNQARQFSSGDKQKLTEALRRILNGEPPAGLRAAATKALSDLVE
jgi:TonB family protein